MPDSVDMVCQPPVVSIAGRRYIPGADRGVAVLLTAASWCLQRLPGQVVAGQRAELIRTLSQAPHLVVEVHCSPAAMVRVRGGQRRRPLFSMLLCRNWLAAEPRGV